MDKPESENSAPVDLTEPFTVTEEQKEGLDADVFDGLGSRYPTPQTLVIHATSSGFEGSNHAQITINDWPLILGKNESDHFRGLHVVTIDPKDGRIAFSEVFDTYKSPKDFDSFIGFEVPFQLGFILVAACMDDCAKSLSDKAKKWFGSMGSKEIDHLEYRQGFVFIGTIPLMAREVPDGRENTACFEKRATDTKDTVSITQAFIVGPGRERTTSAVEFPEDTIDVELGKEVQRSMAHLEAAVLEQISSNHDDLSKPWKDLTKELINQQLSTMINNQILELYNSGSMTVGEVLDIFKQGVQ